MQSLSLKQKVIGIIIVLGLLLIAVFQRGFSEPNIPVNTETQSNEIRIVSTNPAGLKDKREVVVLPDQTIEVTFSESLQNVPETKIDIEPKKEVKIELSDDRKTVKIIPLKPYDLGQGYTLFIH